MICRSVSPGLIKVVLLILFARISLSRLRKKKKSFSDIGKDAKLLPAGKKIKTDIWMFYVYPGVNLAGVEPDRVKLSISSHVTRGPNAKS